MVCLVLLFLAYGIEPAIQYFLFARIFCMRNNMGRRKIIVCWGICYILLVTKQILSFWNKQSGIEMSIFITTIVFYVVSSWRLYKCQFYKAVINVSILLVIAMAAECISFGLLAVAGFGMAQIQMFSASGVLVTYLSKVIYAILCYIFYKVRLKKKATVTEMMELVPLLLFAIMYEAPTIILFNNMKLIEYNDTILLMFASGQIMILLIAVYFWYILKRHIDIEKLYKKRLETDAEKLQSYEEISKVIEELRDLRHDFKLHISVLQQLHMDEQYKELGEYIEKLGSSIKTAEQYILLENRAVAGLLNQYVKDMKDEGIEFSHIIEISDFVLENTDICSLLGNIMDNAVEAASKSDDKIVDLFIKYENTGYKIICKNTYAGVPVFSKGNYVTTKENKSKHGYGIKIIRQTAEKYQGLVKMEVAEKWFTVEVFIPYKG